MSEQVFCVAVAVCAAVVLMRFVYLAGYWRGNEDGGSGWADEAQWWRERDLRYVEIFERKERVDLEIKRHAAGVE